MSELYPCGDKIFFEEGAWKFNEMVSLMFAEHVRKSIPSYKNVHTLVSELVQAYSESRSEYHILDLGCSVGELEGDISRKVRDKEIYIKAVDNSPDMIKRCVYNVRSDRISFECGDLISTLEKCIAEGQSFDMVICLYTLQFLDRGSQFRAMDLISHVLSDGGIFILADKYVDKDPEIDKIKEMSLMSFKRVRGLTNEEVLGKKHALKGVQTRIEFPSDYLLERFSRMIILDASLNFMCTAFFK